MTKHYYAQKAVERSIEKKHWVIKKKKKKVNHQVYPFFNFIFNVTPGKQISKQKTPTHRPPFFLKSTLAYS